jgi:FkbM family methyltransferase
MFNKIKQKLEKRKYKKIIKDVPNCTYWKGTDVEGSKFLSQYGQDKFVAEKLNFKKDGFFVDIGANDGLSFSNSYYFEKELGWNGIAIEPLPETFNKMDKVRDCIKVNGCISNKSGDENFLEITGGGPDVLSGLISHYDDAHLDRIDKELKESGGEKNIIKVPCFPLNELTDKHDINYVDYLSIDTEGNEFEILSSIDFSKLKIDLITVENNYKKLNIYNFLTSRGYKLIALQGSDEIYQLSDS